MRPLRTEGSRGASWCPGVSRSSRAASVREPPRKPPQLPASAAPLDATLRLAHRTALKIKLQRELNDSRVYARVRDLAKSRVSKIGIWIRELRVVEGIKEFRSEFKIGTFARPAQWKLLVNGHVPVILAGSVE